MIRLNPSYKKLSILLLVVLICAGAKASVTPSELQTSLDKADDWHTITALNKIKDVNERKALVPVVVARLPKSSNPSKVAILELLSRWNVALSDADFSREISDASLEVRHAAVTGFIATRRNLSDDDQVTRFQKSFSVMPYQARLEAMQAYLNLPTDEKLKLQKAVGPAFKTQCQAEKKPRVKPVCEKILATQNLVTK